MISLDFARPSNRLFQVFYYDYLLGLFPLFGRLVSQGWGKTLSYLGRSILKARTGKQVASLLTAEQFLVLPDNGQPSELVRGEVVYMPPPGFPHGVVCSNVVYIVRRFLDDHDLGTVTITANGHSNSASYGATSTSSTIASALVSSSCSCQSAAQCVKA